MKIAKLLRLGAQAAQEQGWLLVAEGLRTCADTNTWDEPDLRAAREMLGRHWQRAGLR